MRTNYYVAYYIHALIVFPYVYINLCLSVGIHLCVSIYSYINITEIKKNNCSFLVAGRLHLDQFRTLKDLKIPKGFESMFKEIDQKLYIMIFKNNCNQKLLDSFIDILKKTHKHYI